MSSNAPPFVSPPRTARNPKFDATTTISSDYGIFGIPLSEEECKLVLLPVPWEVTTSYGNGASNGPRIIREASAQIDLFDIETKTAYEDGIFMKPLSLDILGMSKEFKIHGMEQFYKIRR